MHPPPLPNRPHTSLGEEIKLFASTISYSFVAEGYELIEQDRQVKTVLGLCAMTGIKVPIWLVVEVKQAQQILAVKCTDYRMDFKQVYKGALGKFMLGYQKLDSEILEMFDENMAKAVAETANEWIQKRIRKPVERPQIEGKKSKEFHAKMSSLQHAKFSNRFELVELRLRDETAKNEAFRAKMEEKLGRFRTELDRLKSMPGYEVLPPIESIPKAPEESRPLPFYRFIDQDMADGLFKEAGRNHTLFFQFVSNWIFTDAERELGVRQLPQKKLFELEQILGYYYPQGSVEADRKLWRIYKSKLSQEATNKRRRQSNRQKRENSENPPEKRARLDREAKSPSSSNSVAERQRESASETRDPYEDTVDALLYTIKQEIVS
uniref:Uncharacterized protein n=1 Tax=Bursaphelenchus xylophilus TaxID=6326 RepID=A0A1I7RX56_BURXY